MLFWALIYEFRNCDNEKSPCEDGRGIRGCIPVVFDGLGSRLSYELVSQTKRRKISVIVVYAPVKPTDGDRKILD